MKMYFNPGLVLPVMMWVLLSARPVYTQQNILTYRVMHSNKQIGIMTIHRTTSGQRTEFFMASEVRKRLIALFTINETHTETFINGIMMDASVNRKINGKVNAAKKTYLSGVTYTCISGESRQSKIWDPVTLSVLGMHFIEPVEMTAAFSDNFQQLLKIYPIGNHSYKLVFPDGNINIFYYSNGVCSKIVAEHSLYTLEFILVEA